MRAILAAAITMNDHRFWEAATEQRHVQCAAHQICCHTVAHRPSTIERFENSHGRALEDYTAKELNVQEGELLIGSRVLNGWLWCEKTVSTDSGWVPLENLKEVAQ
jgi:hypothetical protein